MTHRELNREDEIQVFSREKHPFYNRVLLPEYLNNHLPWERLLKFRDGEFDQLDVRISTENEVIAVNRERKTITDRHGREHRSEEHTSELQYLMRISYAVFC